jgi:hypothetical protein
LFRWELEDLATAQLAGMPLQVQLALADDLVLVTTGIWTGGHAPGGPWVASSGCRPWRRAISPVACHPEDRWGQFGGQNADRGSFS